MKKLWVSDSRFVEIPEGAAEIVLRDEQAVRSRRPDFWGAFNYLPDPDLVLSKLGAGLVTYRQLATDAHVGACMFSRKGGTLSAEWEIREPAQGGVRIRKNVMEFVEKMLADLDVYRIISDILEAPFYGMAPIEVVWGSGVQGPGSGVQGPETEGRKWSPVRIEGKPPEWFVFSQTNELRFVSTEHQIEGEPVPPMKFMLPRHFPTYDNPYGDRLLSRCFWPVAFKKGGFKYWAVFTEKFGMPWVVGKVPPRTNETERAALLAKLVSMVQDACAVINDDESVEIQGATDKTSSSAVFEGLIEAANAEISKAILGQTLTTEVGDTGSYAASKTHMEVRDDLIDQDKRLVAGTLNELIRWAVALNFAQGTDAPVFAWYEEEDTQKDRADRDKVLYDQGVQLSREYYLRTYNLEETDIEEEEGKRLKDKGQRTKEKGEFAENRADNRFSQEDATFVAEEAAKASQRAVDAMLAPVLKAVEGAKSLEEIGEKLYELYPKMDGRMFQDYLARAMFLSAAGGWVESESENRGIGEAGR